MKQRCVALALGLLIAGLVYAADIPPLTEDDAVHLALAHAPMLRQAAAESAMATAQADMTRADGRLQVSVGGIAALSNMPGILSLPAGMSPLNQQTGAVDGAGLNAMAMLPLSTGGRVTANNAAATHTAAATEQQQALARVTVAAEARRRFADVLAAQAGMTIAGDTVAAADRTALTAQQMFDAGKAPRYDVLRAQADVAVAKQAEQDALAEIAAARARLAQALGVDPATLGTAVAGDTFVPPPDALATAFIAHPNLKAAILAVAAAQDTRRAVDAEWQPQVYAFAMVGTSEPQTMGSRSTGGSIGVVAAMPLVDGGGRKAARAEADAAIQAAQAARDAAQLAIYADVTEAQARLSAARLNITTAEAGAAAATEAYSVAETRYEAGKSTIAELLDARRALTEAQQGVAQARAKAIAAEATFLQAVGVTERFGSMIDN
jgi:outer membrane protein TolC